MDPLAWPLGLPASAAFPAKLEAALKAKGQAVEVVNAGASGDTASEHGPFHLAHAGSAQRDVKRHRRAARLTGQDSTTEPVIDDLPRPRPTREGNCAVLDLVQERVLIECR